MVDRIDRIQHLMKREIAVILQEEINDPRIHHITITQVEVTRDLGIARVYYTSTASSDKKEETEKGLKRAGSFVRKELAERMSLKFMPRITFILDKAIEMKERIDSIFEKIEEEDNKE